ncbi:Uncharacterized protein Rs2_09106 [Raphanus sativus]|nr:Uncharacterized protein Rs2_09106 [Raphanus sativus]
MKLKKTISAKPYWPCLFGKVEVVTVSSVIKMLYRKTVKDKEIRIKYACLALLESVLLPTSVKMKISREHAEAIADLDDFFSYPWGRLAFEMLVGSIKERDEVALSQNTIAVKGFALALQLVLVEAVPALTEGVQELCSSSESDSDDVEGISRDIFAKKNTLNPSHGRNVDKQSNVKVSCLIGEDNTQTFGEANLVWSDEEPDSTIDNLVSRIDTNYKFTTSLFRGGLRHSDVERMRQSCKSTTKSRKSTYGHGHLQHADAGNITSDVIEKIKPQFDNLEKKFKLACRMGDAIEGKVVVHVKQMLDTFKAEMMVSVKDMVATMCKENVDTPNVVCNQLLPTPVTLPFTSTGPADDVDINAETIANVLRNISDYSTPPRSTPISQDENLTPSNKRVGASGFDCQPPGAETYAQSENSQNRTCQNVFQQRLDAHMRRSENLGSEPSFSLGLTQEEHILGADRVVVPEVRQQDCTSQTNVVENNDHGHGSRKSKRQKTVPSVLVADYQCGRHIMARVKEAQKFSFGTYDQSEMRRKYGHLCVKLGQKFVLNVGGIAVSAKDIRQILERPRLLTAKSCTVRNLT